MTWFRVDDGMPDHPSWASASKEAIADWLALGCACARYQTDGWVDTKTIKLRTTRRTRFWLETHGRIHPPGGICDECAELIEQCDAKPRNGAPAWYLHQYLKFNQSRREVESIRQKRAAAGRLGGLAKARADA